MLRHIGGAEGRADLVVEVQAALDDPLVSGIVLTRSTDSVGPAALTAIEALLSDQFGVGAVVPVVRTQGGAVAEAGLLNRFGVAISRHSVGETDSAERTAGDVDLLSTSAVAFPTSLLRPRTLDLVSDFRGLLGLVDELCHRRGLRTVFQPAWEVRRPPGNDPPLEQSRSLSVGAQTAEPYQRRSLLVTGFLPVHSVRGEDRFVQTLIDDLVELNGADDLTIAVLDSFGAAGRSEDLRRSGIEVVLAPRDWNTWFEERWGTYDAIFLTRTALLYPVRQWIEASQPSATRILWLDSLLIRDLSALRPRLPAEEMAGLDHVLAETSAVLANWTAWANAVVCSRVSDANLVRGLSPSTPTEVILPALEIRDVPKPFTVRRGAVLMAPDGFDALASNEDAVLDVPQALLGALGDGRGAVGVDLLATTLSPRLQLFADQHSLRLRPFSRSALADARVALVLHAFGSGGPPLIHAAMEACTPIVASPAASEGVELGGLRDWFVVGTPEDVRARSQMLLDNERVWDGAVAQIKQVLSEQYDSVARTRTLGRLLRDLGLRSGPTRKLWPSPAQPPLISTERRVPPPLIRGHFDLAGSQSDVTVPDDPGERYRHWVKTVGLTPTRMAKLRGAVHALSGPTFSIVMPVFNVSSQGFTEALASLDGQIYERWELCIADDGSTDPETQEVLRTASTDPRVRMVRLRSNRGIVAASNAAIELCSGEYIAFMDQDDLLKPHALAMVALLLAEQPDLDLIYSDEDKIDFNGLVADPHLKPEWSPDLLMSVNYINHLTVARRDLVVQAGGLRAGFDGSQDYDLLLRLTEVTDKIAHIPEPLYSWRMSHGSAAADVNAKPYAIAAGKKAIREALERRGTSGWADDGVIPTMYRTRYSVPGSPHVVIIIPTRNRVDLLRPCVTSILEKSTYINYEIVVVDNGSDDGETLEYLARAPVRVIRYPYHFNYARQVNFAAWSVVSDALLFLNNDTEVISPDWIEALLEHALRPTVGAVGGKLLYGDGRPQHEGILVGVGGWAWNVDHGGYFARGELVRNVSAVTGACVMMRPSVFARVGGNDERLRIAYNDVDLGLRVRQAGFDVVYTPYARLYHYEGASRKGWEHDEDGPLFGKRWNPREMIDPYYSPLFERDRPFIIRT